MKFLILALLSSSLIFAASIDTKKSFIQWSAEKITGSGHTGKIFFKEGNIEIKDEKIQSGSFTVDMTSLTNEDLEGEWRDKFLAHMKSDDFFEIKKYPTSSFKITSVTGKTIKGELTIKGKTQPAKFSYKKDGDFFVGDLSFNRTKFNVIYNSASFFKNLGDKTIKDTVKLSFKFKTK